MVRSLVLSALMLASCTGAPPPTAETSAPEETGPQDGGTLVATISLDPDNVNPLVAPYALSGWVIDLVTPGLVRRKVGEDGLSYEPALASSWTWSEDKLALTYTLREGLHWEDGEPLTAEDVAFTYALMADPKVASNWLGDTKNIAGVDAVDERTVRFRFNEPRNLVLQQGLTHRGIVPKHIFEKADRASLRSHSASRQPLASGPFRVAEWKSNERIVLEPNPKAPADWKPHLDRIMLRVQPETNTRKLALLKGEADFESGVEFVQVPELQKNEELEILRAPADGMMYLGFNHADPKWQDVRVRKALTVATDTSQIIDRLFTVDGEVYAQPCVGTVGPNLGAWYASDLQPLPHDVAQARALLAEAGWTDTDGDGYVDKNGEPLRARVMVQNGTDWLRDTVVLVQGQWKEIGVQLDLEMLDPTTFADRARRHEFDAVLWLFGNNPKVDMNQIWASDGPYNWFQYKNDEVDRLARKGQSSLDLAEAQAAVRESQVAIYNDHPVVFLVWLDTVSVRHQRFKDAQYDTFNGLLHAEEWWVPKAERKY